MIVPSFDDFIASERVTAAKLNKNVRDSGNFYKGRPLAFAYMAAALSVPTGTSTWTTVNLDTEKFDNDGIFTTSTPGRLTIQTPGLYHIEGQVRYASGGTTYRAGRIQINNTTDLDTQYYPLVPSNSCQVYMKGWAQLVAGDFLVISTLHGESTAQSLQVNKDHYTYLRARWVSA
jgi:hypothetical protein